LIDSGANVSAMNHKLISSLNLNISRTDKNNITGPTGNFLETQGQVKLEINCSNRIINQKFIIIKDLQPDIILGRDFLRKTEAIIDFKINKIEIGPTDEYFENKIENVVTKFTNYKDIIIPAQSIMKIEVKTDAKEGDFILEGSQLFYERTGMKICHCITTIKNGKTSIWALNPLSYANKILKKTTLAKGELICENDQLIPDKTISNYLKLINKIGPIYNPHKNNITKENSPQISSYNSLDLKISEHLSKYQKEQLDDLLRRYNHLFLKPETRTQKAFGVKHEIITTEKIPTRQRPYRVAAKEREILEEQVEKMLKEDVIRPSSSPWSSPVILVKKKNGTWRFCVDYRRLNKITVKDVYPLPRIDDIMDSLQGSQFFTSIDMQSSYWQVEVKEEHKQKTAFITPEGLYEFNVMPFGLCNAPATFERLMDNVLRGLKWKTCLCYLDDVIIYSPDFKTHLIRLEAVLKCFDKAGLKLNNEKCKFGFEKLPLFGYIVDKNGIKPDPEKTLAIKNYPKPLNIKQVRSFLGLCSYYRKFIKGFSNIAHPLNDLTKKEEAFEWKQQQEDAFRNLKDVLSNPPVLRHYNPQSKTLLHTDASNIGLGAVLVQNDDGTERVISYASRTLLPAEKNYTTTEKECLAVLWAITKFRPYLYGRPFSVMTDHHALCWLTGLKDPSGRLARWALRLQEYEVTICYKSGKEHADSDALSRGPLALTEKNEDDDDVMFINAIETSKDTDGYMENIKKLMKEKDGKRSAVEENFKLVGDHIYKRNPSPIGQPWLLIIPKEERRKVIEDHHCHITAGHLGITRTFKRLSSRFFWPSMLKSVEIFVKSCHLCQTRKIPPKRKAGLLQPIPPTKEPFERIGIDLLGPLPLSKNRKRWIIVVTDYHTKFVETGALSNGTAIEVANFLVLKVILRHGAPMKLISDRGTQFMSNVMKQVLEKCHIEHNPTTGYHAQTNGLTERFNRTLANMLSMYVNQEHKDWDEILPYVTFAYNTSVQETTGYSPFFLLHAREPITPIEATFPFPEENQLEDYDEYVQKIIVIAEKARALAYDKMVSKQNIMKKHYDKTHRDASYNIGDLVAIWIPIRRVGRAEKLLRRFFGPYRVDKKISPVNYVVIPVEGNSRKSETVHVSRMKPYYLPIEEEKAEMEVSDIDDVSETEECTDVLTEPTRYNLRNVASRRKRS